MRLHLGHVTILGGSTTDTLGADQTDQVEVVTEVPVKHEVDAVVEETEVNTKVELMLLLIGQLTVAQT